MGIGARYAKSPEWLSARAECNCSAGISPKQATQPLDINGGLVPFDEGCKLVKRSPYTVRLWLRQGKLTRYKRGRETFLDPAEFVPQPQPRPKRRANGK